MIQNYKNRLKLAKVIVKNKMSRFYGSVCIIGIQQRYTYALHICLRRQKKIVTTTKAVY